MVSRVEQTVDRKPVKACGICHSTENLVGPYCGGPFMWYCKTCWKVVEVFLEGQERRRKFIKSLRKRRKK